MNLCECECGQECKKRFVSGHNLRLKTYEYAEKWVESLHKWIDNRTENRNQDSLENIMYKLDDGI